MRNHPLVYLVIMLAITLFAVAGSGSEALAQEGETIFITSPADGETVSGIVTVTGAVDFPDFLKYELFLSFGGDLIWGATVYAPVINGDLAMLDTKIFADGAYQMIIRKVNSDSNYTDFVGPTIIIDNGQDSPQPYPEIETSPLYPPVAGALMRLRNCSGTPLEFDYVSPEGFCSSDSLWMEHKPQESPVCTFVDILLIPCEYRGTASGLGEDRGAAYMFDAEDGKIYEVTYPGGFKLFIGESPGTPRASTDTGGLAIEDPARYQGVSDDSAPEAEPASAPAPTSAAAPAQDSAPTDSTGDASDSGDLLPVTGLRTESKAPFIILAIGLILFLIVGGVLAARKRNSAT